MESPNVTGKARVLPRDGTDIMIGLFLVLPVQILPFFNAPPAVAFFVGRAFGWTFLRSFECAFAILLVIYLIWIAFTVWSLRLSKSGLQFVRLFGRPTFLQWDQITEISEAPRREVVVRAWLVARFPSREITPSLYALRHFRIQWSNDYCYYPPEDQ